MAAASIYSNSAGVDTSRARVIPLDSLAHFLEHFQKEGGGGDGGGGEAARLIEVSSERKGTKFLKLGEVDFLSLSPPFPPRKVRQKRKVKRKEVGGIWNRVGIQGGGGTIRLRLL